MSLSPLWTLSNDRLVESSWQRPSSLLHFCDLHELTVLFLLPSGGWMSAYSSISSPFCFTLSPLCSLMGPWIASVYFILFYCWTTCCSLSFWFLLPFLPCSDLFLSPVSPLLVFTMLHTFTSISHCNQPIVTFPGAFFSRCLTDLSCPCRLHASPAIFQFPHWTPLLSPMTPLDFLSPLVWGKQILHISVPIFLN